MKKLSLIVLLTVFSISAFATDVNGDWSGKLDLGAGRALRIVLHVDGATPKVTMDSPDQGAYGLECKILTLTPDSLSITIPNIGMSYTAKLCGDALNGTFKQGMIRLPLNLERGAKKANRPQTPQAPFPYTQEEVRVTNADGSVSLAGTLTVPEGSNERTPVAVLVSGSGAQNRDEELFEHKPFAVIADYLARHGIATLRYDDRGFAESTGDRTTATTADYAEDAQMWLEWLQAQKRFGNVGIIGHSEGGMIAYMLGAADGAPDFIVSIAGPVVDGGRILDYQNKVALMKYGMTEAEAEKQAAVARQRLENDPTQKWYQFFLTYDPTDNVSKLTLPTLIIYGEKDRQVPPALNYEVAKRLAPTAQVRCYAGLNHLMQHAQTGDVAEYAEIEETISPEVLHDIAEFINALPR